VFNAPPVAGADTATTLEGQPVSIAVLANDSDSDGGVLAVSDVAAPAHGTAAIGAGGTITYQPRAGFFGSDVFTYTVVDGQGGAATGTVTVRVSRLGRFVAFSRDYTWLRAGSTVVSGDVGANEGRFHAHVQVADDGDRDDVTMRVGVAAELDQPSSRVVGDTVLMLNRSSGDDVVDNFLLNNHGSVLGAVTTPMTMPFVTLPAFPSVTPGGASVTVAKNKALTLAPGAYGTVRVSPGGMLILTGGLYQMLSLDLDQQATVLFQSATEIRIKTELDTGAKAKLILDPTVAGLRPSQVVIYVAGDDSVCHHDGADDDRDDAGHVSVHVGAQSLVQVNIYAVNGTVWLKSKTQATGAFIGVHVRVGVNATLTLDSAFK
jgi:hypothetical protein